MNVDVTSEVPIRMSTNESDLFRKYLSRSQVYLEFGSGGSTELAVASQIFKMVSIESDPNWVNSLRSKPAIAEAVSAGRLLFELVDIGPVGDWGVPKDHSKIQNWPRYFLTPFTKFEHQYDCILIDGRFRLACAFAAYVFASDTTKILIHDYINRQEYYEVEKFYDIVDQVDTLYVFQKRKNINLRSLYTSVLTSLFRY